MSLLPIVPLLALQANAVRGAEGLGCGITVKTFHFIDLFAGCGGLSLGLERAGYAPLLFSELSEHAGATYLANRVGLVTERDWVKDVHDLTDEFLSAKLREWGRLGREVDLLSGGPPCQGYSGIGHRRTFNLAKKDIPSNHLFKQMVSVIACTKPKIFLFENVGGLLFGRWTKDGRPGEVFDDVLAGAEGFGSLHGQYAIRWQKVYAKDYGVPQNRPRVLVVGIRKDVARRAGLPAENMWAVGGGSFPATAVADGFLPRPVAHKPWDPYEVLVDLCHPGNEPPYSNTEYYCAADPARASQRWYRVTKRCWLGQSKTLEFLNTVTEQEYANHSARTIARFEKIRNGEELQGDEVTKKFGQRPMPREWGPAGPHVTITSLPDDLVHFAHPRTFTVREWARMQTFPDWYVFKGPRTTGGRRRAGDPGLGIWDRAVPRYTQIGNAIPVMLGEQLGLHFRNVLGGG